MDEGRERRRKARAAWPGRLARLDDADDGLVRGATPAERFSMVAELTRDAWAIARLPIPEYARHEMPGRVIRRVLLRRAP